MNKEDIRTYNQTLTKSQIKILDGAKHCIQQWGIEKTSMNDIARHAGVTRQTVYSYYTDKDDVARAALLYSGYELGKKILIAMENEKTTATRLLAAAYVAIEQLPLEPYLSMLAPNMAHTLEHDALNDPEGLELCWIFFKEIYQDEDITEEQLMEIVEVCIRFVISMVMMKGPVERQGDVLKSYIRRYLLRSVGLTTPA